MLRGGLIIGICVTIFALVDLIVRFVIDYRKEDQDNGND